MARKKIETQPDEAPKEDKKVKQGHLPEMEPPSIPEIDDAAEAFVKARKAWQAKQQPMMDAYTILEATMKKHNLRNYEYDGKIVEGSEELKFKVKAKKEDE